MPKISSLPHHVVTRIAAGEVIERPVYAVKELLENSLDAGAQTITIQIENGGLKKIVVTDDGSGMEKEDVLESYKPHTTSKYVNETLVGIPTLGFRGEALASIAAVSTLTIQSRIAESSGGFFVTVSEGVMIESGPVGMPAGTSVTIENLFSSIPARKKFLKSERSEYILILDLITKYALTYPHIRFLLLHNGRVSIDVAQKQPLEKRVHSLLKKNVAEQLMYFSNEDEYVKFSGYITHPQLSTSSQSKQWVIINNRPVADRFLSSVIREAYGGLLAKNRYPIFLLSLEIPYEAVDVNVHPRKEQVGIVGKDALKTLLYTTVKQILEKNDLRHTFPIPQSMTYRSRSTSLDAADLLREKSPLWNVKEEGEQLQIQSIQQFNKTYLMCTSKNSVVIIDQHAAHERILYEQLMDTYKKIAQKINVLKDPLVIDISEQEKEILFEYESHFNTIGIQFIHNEGQLLVTHIPEVLKDHTITSVFQEMIDAVRETESIGVDSLTDSMITYIACRNAVKAGEVLTAKEAKRLVEKLAVTDNNTTCPHGRPTTLKLLATDLHTWFKRG